MALWYNRTMDKRKKITIGILAHVDAGKTTLSEGILFQCGAIRKIGRVDRGDAFLDTEVQEKERGITIFSKEARVALPSAEITLLDTPGHVDFSAEMERTLQVMDYAVLVINGREGVQGHALTLWKLIRKYGIPAFAFVNKMDLCARDGDAAEAKAGILEEMQKAFDGACIDFTGSPDGEEVAMRDEKALEEYLREGSIGDGTIAKAIAAGRIVPCYFGSALKAEGVDGLLAGLDRYCLERCGASAEDPFAARVYKITRDKQGERLTHLKVLSGMLRTRMIVKTAAGGDGEKVNQIRLYSGEKYAAADEAGPGSICAVTGFKETFAGQLLPYDAGTAETAVSPELEAALTYSVILPQGVSAHDAYRRFKELEEEDPQLRITWDERAQKVQIRLMGQVQLEVLQGILSERFGIDAAFGEGRISYRETVAEAVEGAGHFEPLRHYAEVHLRIEPLPRGSGIKIDSACSEDALDKNWQRLILTHLAEREHIGTLVGAPITDVRITLLAGRAHLKHTEGGDFRQATYRAIRQGLRKSLAAGQMLLLEPWYEFDLQLPAGSVGRAMSDIQGMGGVFEDTAGEVLRGRAPVSEMKDYAAEVASYTHGFGHLTCRFCGYAACHNPEEVIEAAGYDADGDIDNPADSVFCFHGAGRNVPWDRADAEMHLKGAFARPETSRPAPAQLSREGKTGRSRAEDEELEAIFERTYGSRRKESEARPAIEARTIKAEKRKTKKYEKRPEYLLVDGYNIIFAWEELRALAQINIDSAREALVEILSNYQGYQNCNLIAVFDAYRVKGGVRRIEAADNITVVYTKEAETADTYIERTSYELSGQDCDVRVATSDRLEQMIILGHNARKVSADAFKKEVEQVNETIGRWIAENNWKNRIDHPNRIQLDVSEQDNGGEQEE